LDSATSSLKGRSLTSRPIAHSISKKPAQNKSSMESDEGEGGNAEALRGVGGMFEVSTESKRKIRFRVTTHAERANHSGFCPK